MERGQILTNSIPACKPQKKGKTVLVEQTNSLKNKIKVNWGLANVHRLMEERRNIKGYQRGEKKDSTNANFCFTLEVIGCKKDRKWRRCCIFEEETMSGGSVICGLGSNNHTDSICVFLPNQDKKVSFFTKLCAFYLCFGLIIMQALLPTFWPACQSNPTILSRSLFSFFLPPSPGPSLCRSDVAKATCHLKHWWGPYGSACCRWARRRWLSGSPRSIPVRWNDRSPRSLCLTGRSYPATQTWIIENMDSLTCRNATHDQT